jgi:hypothetical protein
VSAVVHGHGEVATGVVLGSNVFNVPAWLVMLLVGVIFVPYVALVSLHPSQLPIGGGCVGYA